MSGRVCSVEGCERGTIARGLCELHWRRQYRLGSTFSGLGNKAGILNPKWRGGKSGHPLYWIYNDLVARCTRPTHARYANYGGRGITVCDRWRGLDGFWNFVEDMGPRPAGKRNGRALYSVDRIDNNAGYSPENCRWATNYQQTHNRRTPKCRPQRGSDNSSSKLTERDVIAIRKRVANGEVQRRMALEYGVSVSALNNAVTGKSWGWLAA